MCRRKPHMLSSCPDQLLSQLNYFSDIITTSFLFFSLQLYLTIYRKYWMLWSVKHGGVTMILIKSSILNGCNPLSFQHYGSFKETISLSQAKQKLTWSKVFGRSSTQYLTMSIWIYNGKNDNHMKAITERTENDQRTIAKRTATEPICCSNAVNVLKTMAAMIPKSSRLFDWWMVDKAYFYYF